MLKGASTALNRASANRQYRSFLRHSGLAQTGEISGFEQGADFRHTPMSDGSHAGDARITIVAAELPGFREFGGGACGFASQGIGRGEPATSVRCGRNGAAPFFEPDDRLGYARLQQMHTPDLEIAPAEVGIAGAEADSLLHERDHLVYRPGKEPTRAPSRIRVRPPRIDPARAARGL